MKFRKTTALFFIIILFLLLLSPTTSVNGARLGLLLWSRSVFPNLMPFMVISNIIINLNCSEYIGRPLSFFTKSLRLPPCAGYVILIGLLCGYPMGSYICCELNKKGQINDKDCNYLCSVCNNVSPMFLIGYVTYECLGENNLLGLILIMYISIFIAFILLRIKTMKNYGLEINDNKNSSNTPYNTINEKNILIIINQSIEKAIESSLKLCIFIMLFSIVAEYVKLIKVNDIIKAGVMTLCEITSGLNYIKTINLENEYKLLLATALTSFGGLSGVFQTASLGLGSALNITTYVKNKAKISVITLVIAVLFVYIFKL